MKTLRIALVDCGQAAHVAKGILDLVKDRYDVQLTQALDADYVFHSCLGYGVLKYAGVRIFVTGEMVSPDFNISDYALSFDRLRFGDRNLWFPLIKLYKDAYACLRQPREAVEDLLLGKRGFCAYVMSNTKNSAPERIEIFDKLNACKTVSSGGRWRNNVGGPVKNKLAFQRQHKFVIAFENQSHPGYLTEKFAQAAASGAIPIYWGDPAIADYFNPKAFVNCHDFKNLDAVVARVIEIDSNDALYQSYLTEPWFINGEEPLELRDATAINFLTSIFDPPVEEVFRRNRGRWGLKYEQRLQRMWQQPLHHGLRRLRDRLRGKN